MADVKLSTGKQITFDLFAINIAEYRSLFEVGQPKVKEDELLSRVSGLTVEEYLELPYPDWRQLTLAFFTKAREPLNDPNSESESTST